MRCSHCGERSGTVVGIEATPTALQGVLRRILGVLARTEHPVTVAKDGAPVGCDEAPPSAAVILPATARSRKRTSLERFLH